MSFVRNITESRRFPAVMSFILPLCLAALAFGMVGIFPFSPRSMLIVDMSSEYVDYYAQLRETLLSGGNIHFWFSMSMGLSPIGLFAYYLASPFNLLLVLFPESMMLEVIWLITMLKIGTAGLLFHHFAVKGMGLSPKTALIPSVAWALSSYVISYSSNIMWMDAVALLPLVILGAIRIMEGKSGWLFFASLAVSFFAHYYISYMVGVFSFCFVLCFAVMKRMKPRAFFGRTAAFVGWAALAAGCVAFLLLPAFLQLKTGQTVLFQSLPELSPKFTPQEFFSKLTIGSYDTIGDGGLPNIYCGMLAGVSVPLFFVCGGVPRREKAVMALLMAFLVIGFWDNRLDLVWHAFDYPTWYEFRNSFLFSFLMLYMTCRVLKNPDTLPKWGVILAVVLASAAAAVGLLTGVRHLDRALVVASVVAAAAYGMLLGGSGDKRRKLAMPMLLLLLMAELAINARVTVEGLDQEFGYDSRESYVGFVERYREAVAAIPQDAGFYRTENIIKRSANDAFPLGVNSISHYSTTTNQNLNYLLWRMGHDVGTLNEIRFSQNTAAGNALLGIRYLLAEGPVRDGGAYELAGQSGDIWLYENPYALPLVFAARGEALTLDVSLGDAFYLQERMLNTLSGAEETLFRKLPWMVSWAGNASIETETDGTVILSRDNPDEPAGITFTVLNPDEQPVYFYMPVKNGYHNGALLMDGENLGGYFTYRHNGLLPILQTQESSFGFLLPKEDVALYEISVQALDISTLARISETLRAGEMEITHFEDTRIEGTITLTEGQVVVTTIPFDRGWSVTADGVPVEMSRFVETFLAVELPVGTHQLAFTFVPQGHVAGTWVSVVSVILLLGLGHDALRKKRASRRKTRRER